MIWMTIVSEELEFQPWPKIGRVSPFKVTVSEKMDGTNACIIIKDAIIIAVQSRKQFITPEADNFNFALWVKDNSTDLLKLGEGHHYGEWVGPGIQKNPHQLKEKTFFLFNTARWNPDNPNRPDCCKTVPVLFQGTLEAHTIPELLKDLTFNAIGTNIRPEGVVCYYASFKKYTKHTIKSPNGKWCKD